MRRSYTGEMKICATETGFFEGQANLSALRLTTLVHAERFLQVTEVDLSGNEIASWEWCAAAAFH